MLRFFVSVLLIWPLLLSAETDWVLNTSCPAGFELTTDNRCELRTLYQFYESNQNRGIGGTRTALPAHRDGFTPQQIDLGRYLFFDPLLSGDHTLSCASCHKPELGFTDGKAFSNGSKGQQTERSAPTLWNTAFLTSFFWDARAASLEEQAQASLYSAIEMATSEAQLLHDLNEEPNYIALFTEAFPEKNAISLDQVYTALSAFQTSLISLNSRYDQYVHGNHAALNGTEIAGLNIFRSFVARCAECHSPPLFTNNQIAVIGSPEPNGRALDIGAEKTYATEKLKGGFKVPTLRNIDLTAPYMHSGVFSNLREAAEFYTKGRGHAVPEGVDLQLHWHIWEPNLQAQELDLLVAFMGTLRDESFLPQIPQRLPSGIQNAILKDTTADSGQ